MKVALIGDIHANLPALESVLAHIREQGIDRIWNVGDFVGYGAFPEEVVELFRTAEELQNPRGLSIIGNYDLKVLRFPERRKKWRKKKKAGKYLAFKWAYERLSKKSRKYLRFLSKEMRLKVKGRRILLTHASPASDQEPLTMETPENHLKELARTAKADIIICGHSHQPFVREVGGVWFINPGSVGRPDDGDPRACYAVLEITSDSVDVQHYRVEYDTERAANAIREQELPEAFAEMVLQGRSLDDVEIDEE
jgi:putative phosphoesterase